MMSFMNYPDGSRILIQPCPDHLPIQCSFGATCLLYKDLLKHFSEESQTDFYILPSSIHEVILVPTLENDCYGELSDMVREVNDSQLMDDEILSTHAYYYSRCKNEITM